MSTEIVVMSDENPVPVMVRVVPPCTLPITGDTLVRLATLVTTEALWSMAA